ncbi:MAG TPA: NAD-dependent epimerase/dehydratase family protein [Myxococcales bacterium]|nr:NAD-dependent epimerase/dehydratase family protein [Myxococcales bacterium]
MKIAITGATGFLGGHVIERLVHGGHGVTALARGEAPRLQQRGVTIVRGELPDPRAAAELVKGAEALIHLAGRVSRDPADGPAMYRLHVEGTRRLLEAALAAGVARVILASTSGTIGVFAEERVATEADDYPIETVGRWPYYLSKIYEEKLALSMQREKGLPVVCLNPSLILGPGDERLSSVGDVWRFLHEDIPAMPSGGLSFVDVRDAAQAFEAALTRGRPGERYLLGGANMPFTEFFGRLSRLTGVPPPRLRLPSRVNVFGAGLLERWSHFRGVEPPIDRASVEMGEHWFDVDSGKAREELGFAPRDPQETLRDTVRFLQKRLERPAAFVRPAI